MCAAFFVCNGFRVKSNYHVLDMANVLKYEFPGYFH